MKAPWNPIALGAAMLMCAAPVSVAQAQSWEPTRTIEIIVPAGTGGGADQMARVVQGIVTKYNLTKQSMVVVNKGGGAGGEGFLDVKASKGDPHKLIITAANVVFVGLVFLIVSPLLALLAFLPIPVIVYGSLRYQTRLEPRYAKVRAAAGTISDSFTNAIGGMATIKAFSGEEREAELVGAESSAYRDANREAIRSSTAFNPLIRMAVNGEVRVRQWLEKPPSTYGRTTKGRRRYADAQTFLGPVRMITRQTRH